MTDANSGATNGWASHLLEQLESRRRTTSKMLEEFCVSRGLDTVLAETQRWAIVGGVVRDSLLDPFVFNRYFWPPWPDIDVAILSNEPNRNNLIARMEAHGITVSINTFGGIKGENEKLGRVDLWCVGRANTGDAFSLWNAYLETVDFGPNAVLFCWPEAAVIQHDRWWRDITSQRVSRTSGVLHCREIQPLRAIALAQKLERTLHRKFELDAPIRSDLRWLVTKAPDAAKRRATRYLENKLTTRRWPNETKTRLIREASRYKRSQRFLSLVCDTHPVTDHPDFTE